jgi:hypothetical protein
VSAFTPRQLLTVEHKLRFGSAPDRIAALFFLAIGFISVACFHAHVYFPLWCSIVLGVIVIVNFLWKFKVQKTIGVLMMIMLGVYLLPFIHIPPYLWFDFNSDPKTLWGLAVNPYMVDETVIQLTAMLGATGAVGMGFAASFCRTKIFRDTGAQADGTSRYFSSLSFLIWFLWLLIGVWLSWISAPREIVFDAAYTMSASLVEGKNFSSAWMMSYVVLSYVFVDTLIDRNPKRRAWKWILCLVTIIYIVIWLQLLRGDRESVPWVFGLILVYSYWAAPLIKHGRDAALPWLKIAFSIFFLVFVSMVIGAMRSNVVGYDFDDVTELLSSMFAEGALGISNMLSGTWSAVLLTPLSVAGDYLEGLLRFKWGETYVDIFLSLPPGFIADAFVYERPLDGTTGLAWEMRYGIGGTHASVAPLVNFGMLGVFVIPALWSSIFLRYEKNALKRLSVINLSFLATIVMAAPHWLWYGEKSGLNAVILWAILAFFYRISLSLSKIFSSRNGLPQSRADNHG